MKVEFDQEFEKEVLDRIKRKYNLFTRHREGLHQSDLGYCITRTYWKWHSPDQPTTDDDALLFAIGLALEEVLLENGADTHRPEPVEIDGIWISPDHALQFAHGLAELKSTRISIPDGELTPKNDWPAGWIRQMKSYTVAQHAGAWDGVELDLPYRLAVYMVIPAKLAGRKFTFTDQEINEHWQWMLYRKDALLEAQEQGKPPEPFAYVESQKRDDWECVRCPFIVMCDAMKMTGNYVPLHRGDKHGV